MHIYIYNTLHPQVWMVIFPEGTRMNPELPDVIENSKQFAKDQGIPIYSHVGVNFFHYVDTCYVTLYILDAT